MEENRLPRLDSAQQLAYISGISGALLPRIEALVSSSEPIAAKDLRVITGALKDIRELQSSAAESGEQVLSVSFAGEEIDFASR